jgi:hypothetical protein
VRESAACVRRATQKTKIAASAVRLSTDRYPVPFHRGDTPGSSWIGRTALPGWKGFTRRASESLRIRPKLHGFYRKRIRVAVNRTFCLPAAAMSSAAGLGFPFLDSTFRRQSRRSEWHLTSVRQTLFAAGARTRSRVPPDVPVTPVPARDDPGVKRPLTTDTWIAASAPADRWRFPCSQRLGVHEPSKGYRCGP